MSLYFHRISRISLRSFTTSAPLGGHSQDLYAALEISPQATPAEVKKSFYALSKRHHPDHNPTDPTATQRFLDISEAYAILSIPAKRHEYDRARSQTHASSSSAAAAVAHRRASYASSTSSSPAGGRPASGLSRRRAQFRGPPPSFYRSGGWGSYEEKRRTAQGQTGPGTPANDHRDHPAHQHSQYPFGEQNDVRHFNREAHYKTQLLQEQRRRWRNKMERQRVPMVDGKGIARDLCIIGGILSLMVMIPSMFWGKTKSGNDAASRRRT